MNRLAVDAVGRTARAGGGTTWAQLDAATAEHGLAAPGARVSSLGVAGTARRGQRLAPAPARRDR